MTLMQLKAEFDHWRANKNSGAYQIPEYLWDKVFLLERQGDSISSLRRSLSISGNQISAQRIKRKQTASTPFVEITPSLVGTTTNDERCRINLNFCDKTLNLNMSMAQLEHLLPKLKGLLQ